MDAQEIRALVAPYTMQKGKKLQILYDIAANLPWISRTVVQCGVWKGGALALLAACCPKDATVWGFDSFQGCAKPTEKDCTPDGKPGKAAGCAIQGASGNRETCGVCVANQTDVEAALRAVGAQRSRVRIVSGWIQDTLNTCDIPAIDMLHIDVDFYEPTLCALKMLWDKVMPGGWVVLDDYNYWTGCRKAADEFFGGNTEQLHRDSELRLAGSAIAFRKDV